MHKDIFAQVGNIHRFQGLGHTYLLGSHYSAYCINFPLPVFVFSTRVPISSPMDLNSLAVPLTPLFSLSPKFLCTCSSVFSVLPQALDLLNSFISFSLIQGKTNKKQTKTTKSSLLRLCQDLCSLKISCTSLPCISGMHLFFSFRGTTKKFIFNVYIWQLITLYIVGDQYVFIDCIAV